MGKYYAEILFEHKTFNLVEGRFAVLSGRTQPLSFHGNKLEATSPHLSQQATSAKLLDSVSFAIGRDKLRNLSKSKLTFDLQTHSCRIDQG